MTVQGDSTRITLLVTKTFERLGIPYAIGGSLASSLHGVMRSTLDVDIVADMRIEHIYETAFKVDVFIQKSRAFDQMQLERRRTSIIATDPE